MKKRRNFTPEFKSKIVLLILTGRHTKAEMCREYKLHPNVVERWKNEFIEAVPTIFKRADNDSDQLARIAELERMVGRLTMENEILKKAQQLLNLDRKKSGSY